MKKRKGFSGDFAQFFNKVSTQAVGRIEWSTIG
jgi:hypothetical protein